MRRQNIRPRLPKPLQNPATYLLRKLQLVTNSLDRLAEEIPENTLTALSKTPDLRCNQATRLYRIVLCGAMYYLQNIDSDFYIVSPGTLLAKCGGKSMKVDYGRIGEPIKVHFNGNNVDCISIDGLCTSSGVPILFSCSTRITVPFKRFKKQYEFVQKVFNRDPLYVHLQISDAHCFKGNRLQVPLRHHLDEL